MVIMEKNGVTGAFGLDQVHDRFLTAFKLYPVDNDRGATAFEAAEIAARGDENYVARYEHDSLLSKMLVKAGVPDGKLPFGSDYPGRYYFDPLRITTNLTQRGLIVPDKRIVVRTYGARLMTYLAKQA
jgi:hypothetical protein